MVNPCRTPIIDADFRLPSIYVPSTCSQPRFESVPPRSAGPPTLTPGRDTGRAAAGRAGSFNSGKNTQAPRAEAAAWRHCSPRLVKSGLEQGRTAAGEPRRNGQTISKTKT